MLPTGAWNLWRDEVRLAGRDPLDVDLLFRAAMHDAAGLDALDDGLPGLAAMRFRESQALILRMAREKVA